MNVLRRSCSMVQLAKHELYSAKERVAPFLPASAVVTGTLEMNIKYGLMDKPGYGTRIYVPKNEKPTSLVVTTPAFSTKRIQSLTVFWDTTNEKLSEVGNCLASLPDIDWTKPTFISISPINIIDSLEELVIDGMLGGGEMDLMRVDRSQLFYLRDTPLEQMKVPEGLMMDNLTVDDIPTIVKEWSYKWTETPEGLATLLESVPAFCLRWVGVEGFEGEKQGNIKKKNGISGERSIIEKIAEEEKWPLNMPVSWMYAYNNGMSGNGYVHPRLRGRNVFQAVYPHLHNTLYQDIFAYTIITNRNKNSIDLARRSGYIKGCEMEASIIIPKGMIFDYKHSDYKKPHEFN